MSSKPLDYSGTQKVTTSMAIEKRKSNITPRSSAMELQKTKGSTIIPMQKPIKMDHT